MEKFGFVYIWYDSWRKMYYIGSHWGTENDGYVCSSNRMRKSYKRRPKDFKRKILKRIFTCRQDMLDEEYKYLSLIKDIELGKKYYNLTNHKNGHWSSSEQKTKTLKQKISQKTKEAMCRPEVREKYLEGLKNRNTNSSDQEVIEKRRQSMIKTMEKKFPKENRLVRNKIGSEEYIKAKSQKSKEIWDNLSEEKKKKFFDGSNTEESRKKRSNKLKQRILTEEHKKKISQSNTGKKHPPMSEETRKKRSLNSKHKKWWNNGTINRRSEFCPGEEWMTGRKKNAN